MTTRCFAFGCSITSWIWGTCADFIGSNFDEYYNLGKSGASNTFSSNRLIEANSIFKFNSDTDTVLVGVTGFGRLSFYSDGWETHGDILGKHPEAVSIFNSRWGIYNSYIAIKTIKEYLTLRNIKHYIYPAVDYKHWLNDFSLLGLEKEDTLKVMEIENILDIKEPLYEWMRDQRRQKKSHPITFNDGEVEMHPTQQEHFLYMCMQFPEFNTSTSQHTYQLLEKALCLESKKLQGDTFNKTYTHKKTVSHSLFIYQ